MSDISDQASHIGYDSTDHQTSYIFVSPALGANGDTQRPTKRRRTSKQSGGNKQTSLKFSAAQFPRLLNGIESEECRHLREQLYEESWKEVEDKILSIVKDANETTLDEVAKFVDDSVITGHEGPIPTGLIVTGPNIASQELLFSQLTSFLRSDSVATAVALRSSDAPNLKTVLKKLIRDATNQWSEDDDFAPVQIDGRKLLNYDLQALYNHVKDKGDKRIVVAFQDSEAFDSGLLSEILYLFSSWQDRIPFVLLFGIATSVELFHERLPRGVARLLHGAQFDVEQTSKTLSKIFRAAVASEKARLIMGSNFITDLLDRQEEHVQSLQTFIMSLRYAYMSHFYANPLSVFLAGPERGESLLGMLQPEHFEALRMLPSFQAHVEYMVEEQAAEEANSLLENDEVLLDYVKSTLMVEDGIQDVSDEATGSLAHIAFVQLLHQLELLIQVSKVSRGPAFDYIELYLKAFDGTLKDSDIVASALEGLKYMNGLELANAVAELIGTIASWFEGDEQKIEFHTEDLTTWHKHITEQFGVDSKSKYTLEKQQTKTLRTTVIAQRVHLSEQQTAVSSSDLEEAKEYTVVVDAVVETLQTLLFFRKPNAGIFHEIYLYDSKTPNRPAFTPKPRSAIENGLCNPHAYLDCECCDPSEEGLLSSNPPTAILYQLYLETGGLINVYDLWSAFYAIVSGEKDEGGENEGEGKEDGERMALAMFYRAVAELKMLGMVKMSRKKTDHLAKTAWRGL